MQRSGGPGAASLPDVAGDAEATDNTDDDARIKPPPRRNNSRTRLQISRRVKTPQQMLQEMQQRQLQLQQQQQQAGHSRQFRARRTARPATRQP